MAKGALTVVNQSTDMQAQGKNQKFVLLLEVSTNKQISTESNLSTKPKKIFKDKKKLPKAAGKENTPLLGCSEGKITRSDSTSMKSKKTKSSTKSVQSVKTISKAVPKLTKSSTSIKESPNKFQGDFHFSPVKPVATNTDVFEATVPNKNVSVTSPSGLSEDSGFESSSRVSDQSTRSSAVSDNEASILTCETPPEEYWIELAEQERITQEMDLYEIKSLRDQIAVLEAEYSQLKLLANEAEEFADIVKRQVQGRSQNSLHLQVSANKQISQESNSSKEAELIFRDKKKLPKAAIKEDIPLLRCSKHEISTSDSKQNTDSSSMKSKKTKSSTKSVQSVKTKSKPVPKLTKKSSTVIKEESPNKVQSNSHFSPAKPVATNKGVFEPRNSNKNVSTTSPLELSKGSGFESSCRVSDQRSPLGKELSEQIRTAREGASYEKELLRDQIAVLEAENSQLKQVIKAAEELAVIIEAILK